MLDGRQEVEQRQREAQDRRAAWVTAHLLNIQLKPEDRVTVDGLLDPVSEAKRKARRDKATTTRRKAWLIEHEADILQRHARLRGKTEGGTA